MGFSSDLIVQCSISFSGHLRWQFKQSVGRNRVARSLRRVDPEAAAARHHATNRLINPQIYHGRYFGYNLHMDQNEKVHTGLYDFLLHQS